MQSVPTPNHQFTELMAGVREGSSEAIRILIDTYGRHIRRAVRRHLNSRIRRQFDSLDFSQAVWASFFKRLDRCPAFSEPPQLIAFLVKISKNKVIDECRKRLQTRRYNVAREQCVPASGIAEDQRAPGTSPTPSAILAAKEKMEQLLANEPHSYAGILLSLIHI